MKQIFNFIDIYPSLNIKNNIILKKKKFPPKIKMENPQNLHFNNFTVSQLQIMRFTKLYFSKLKKEKK